MDNKEIIKGDEIDLIALVKTIWAGRKIIYYSVAICFCIGLIIAFTSQKKYTASATLLPSADKKTGNMGGLSSLAGLAGVNLGSMMGQNSSGIPSELYPQVVASVPYLKELIHEKLTWKEYPGKMSVYDFLKKKSEEQSQSIGTVIYKYSIGLPWTIKDAILGKPEEESRLSINSADNVGYLILSPEEQAAIVFLKNAIKVEQDKKSELIQVDVIMQEPLLAAQIADKAVGLLQKYVIEYKSKQAREQLTFIESRYTELSKEYESARNKILYYRDTHRNMVNERSDIEYQRLSDSYDMSATVFKGLAQQLEQARITVKEETPVFTILEPVLVPKEKSAPKRGMMIAISIFLGGFMGLIGTIISHLMPTLKTKFQKLN
jgi:uncharacterized protein involved in exopolysaccharide biosynthesis